MERILEAVYRDRRLTVALKLLSHIIVLYAVAHFAYHLLVLAQRSLADLAVAVITSGVSLFAVSLARRLIKAPRPREIYGFYGGEKPKRSASFPSRHAFSVFFVAVSALTTLPSSAAVLLVLGVLLCAARVLVGLHFIRDCVAGALIGIIAGALCIAAVALV